MLLTFCCPEQQHHNVSLSEATRLISDLEIPNYLETPVTAMEKRCFTWLEVIRLLVSITPCGNKSPISRFAVLGY